MYTFIKVKFCLGFKLYYGKIKVIDGLVRGKTCDMLGWWEFIVVKTKLCSEESKKIKLKIKI